MIERMPLGIFGDSDDSAGESDGVDIEVREDAVVPADIVVEPAPAADVLLVTCQWCSEQFDNKLTACPGCNARHVPILAPPEEPTTSTCQWCLTTFEIGPTVCPECNGRVVIPGQNVPGEADIPLDYNSLGVMSRRAHSNQLLVGLMIGGTVDSVIGGLVGMAISALDDD